MGFPKSGVPFEGPYNKDYRIWGEGSILGSPFLGKIPKSRLVVGSYGGEPEKGICIGAVIQGHHEPLILQDLGFRVWGLGFRI